MEGRESKENKNLDCPICIVDSIMVHIYLYNYNKHKPYVRAARFCPYARDRRNISGYKSFYESAFGDAMVCKDIIDFYFHITFAGICFEAVVSGRAVVGIFKGLFVFWRGVWHMGIFFREISWGQLFVLFSTWCSNPFKVDFDPQI